MATLQETVERYGAEPRAPKLERQKIPQRTVWQRIKGEWPEFDPPRIPASGLTIVWLWLHVLDDDPTPPTAEEIAAEAAEADRRHPETQEAGYRRSHSDWLERRLASNAEYYSHQAWHELEAALDGRRGLPGERLAWLQTHERAIRALIENAKAEHRRRWPVGVAAVTSRVRTKPSGRAG